MNLAKANRIYNAEMRNARRKPASAFYSINEVIMKVLAIDDKLDSWEYDFIHSVKFVKRNALTVKQISAINRIFNKHFQNKLTIR
jgi:hypothetical protein